MDALVKNLPSLKLDLPDAYKKKHVFLNHYKVMSPCIIPQPLQGPIQNRLVVTQCIIPIA